jgi:hypothetical protein
MLVVGDSRLAVVDPAGINLLKGLWNMYGTAYLLDEGAVPL